MKELNLIKVMALDMSKNPVCHWDERRIKGVADDWLTMYAGRRGMAEIIDELEQVLRLHLGEWEDVEALYCPMDMQMFKHALAMIENWKRNNA